MHILQNHPTNFLKSAENNQRLKVNPIINTYFALSFNTKPDSKIISHFFKSLHVHADLWPFNKTRDLSPDTVPISRHQSRRLGEQKASKI